MKYHYAIVAGLIVGFVTSLPVLGQSRINLSRYEGVTRPAQQVQLSAPVDGIVEQVLVVEGEYVKEGQPLLQMDDAIQRLSTESSRLQAESDAQILRAQYALEEAQILLDRVTTSFEKDAASEWEVRRTRVQRDQATADLQLAKDNKLIAEKRYELELERLDRYRLDAPFDGVVLRRTVESGETVQTEDSLLAIVSISPIRAEIHLPAEVYGDMKLNAMYGLIGSAPASESLRGRLTIVDAIIDPASQTFRCVFEIDNPDGGLPSGFVVRLASLEPAE
ncbi:efflux RND transporter periplasmic adaptor subunit [Mucisphaera calidilacus]|uniref:Multidrug resistance protein MdtE n=1 Tax=Mucisphaera calidilacus TaxID=2527982 RepID=A0A518BTS5_9BACT|nr:efflux RND transporter periplasmic adaptor subunit [Mucisphaera calidilacus]QDU70373.1 Multidrug resistance protein MdtE precursor [Mucisphaera calidilacus]